MQIRHLKLSHSWVWVDRCGIMGVLRLEYFCGRSSLRFQPWHLFVFVVSQQMNAIDFQEKSSLTVVQSSKLRAKKIQQKLTVNFCVQQCLLFWFMNKVSTILLYRCDVIKVKVALYSARHPAGAAAALLWQWTYSTINRSIHHVLIFIHSNGCVMKSNISFCLLMCSCLTLPAKHWSRKK